ncbi:autolysin modifier protein, partial [Enterococcus faecalis]|nr:autolysin modifier protein [Enterococcus faecalis]
RGELEATTISDITEYTTQVKGSAEPNAKIELKNGNTVIATGTVGSDGKYSLTISKQPAGSTIVAVVTLDGKTSQASTVVKEGQTKGTVTPNNYQIGSDNYLRGTYTGDVDSLKLLVNGKLYAKSTVSGSPFKYYVADKIKKATDQVYIIAYDRNGKELDRKPVTVKEPEVTINLKVDSYAVGGVNKYVEGSFSGTGLDQVSYIRLEVNDILYQRMDKSANNTFTYYAIDKIKSTGDKAYIVVYDV